MTKTSFIIVALLMCGNPANATVRNFFAPESQGQRLDSCLTGDHDCGKPAADAFCKAQGFETALIFQREAAVETVKLGNGAFCTGPACTSFKQIKCFAAGDAVTAAPN